VKAEQTKPMTPEELHQIGQDAKIALCANHGPQFYWSTGFNINAPLLGEEAAALRRLFRARYRDWTGRDLGIDLEDERMGRK
jgi:hypothetical protein